MNSALTPQAISEALRLWAPWFPWWKLRAAAADLTHPAVLAVILACVLMERRQRTGPPPSRLRQNAAAWFLILNTTALYFLSLPLIEFIQHIYARAVPFFDLRLMQSYPLAAQVCVGLFMEDFTQYLYHRSLHRFSWLWPFHAVHHTESELWAGSNFVDHLLAPVIGYAIRAIPLGMIGAAPVAIFHMRLIARCWGLFIHSRTRFPAGPLQYVLVTPQYHAVHHSLKTEHQDKNFATYLTLWDVLLGTACWRLREPLEFGLDGESLYRERGMLGALRTWGRMQWLPFTMLFKRR